MRADYTDVFQDVEAVRKYEDVEYAPDSYSTAVNVRQRRYLRRLVRDAFPARSSTQHDFACGTGRAVEALHGLVRAAHGYDTSTAMIDRARANGRSAQWHVIDATGPVPAPMPTLGPSIVTVFRLLLNVPDDVRDRAVAFAARALPTYPSGLLVVQNHGSARSLRHLRRRHRTDHPWYAELSDQQVYELLDRHGFAVVRRRGLAVFPKGWYAPRLTRPLVRRLDDVLCAMRVLDPFATDVLYVARRVRPAAPPEFTAEPDGRSAP